MCVNDCFLEGHTSTYVMTAQSCKTLQIGKFHLCNVFLKDVLKDTAS